MPELPEVETIRRDLARKLVGARLRSVEVRLPKITVPRGAAFGRRLAGVRVTGLRRRAKLLCFDLAGRTGQRSVLLVHLKMTGQLVLRHHRQIISGGHPIVGARSLPNQYTHVVFHFTNGDVLYFNDLRQFGYLKLVRPAAAAAVLRTYGPEPLGRTFTAAAFATTLVGRPRARLKAVLLDQTAIAGVGNIYADEACFRAGLRPSRLVGSLTSRERHTLWRAIRSVLALSVRHRGTTFSTYVDADGRAGQFWRYRKVYGRSGQPCRACGTIVKRTTVAGRGTAYCPRCQR